MHPLINRSETKLRSDKNRESSNWKDILSESCNDNMCDKNGETVESPLLIKWSYNEETENKGSLLIMWMLYKNPQTSQDERPRAPTPTWKRNLDFGVDG